MPLLKDRPPFKDVAGALAAFIVVIAFITLGFVQGLGKALLGVDVTLPDSWSSGLFGLANMALGYLIGKTDSSPLGADKSLPQGEWRPPVATQWQRPSGAAGHQCQQPGCPQAGPVADEPFDPRSS